MVIVMRRFAVAAAAIFAAASIACGPASTSADQETIGKADKELQAAVARKDLEKVISFYSDDARLMPAAKPAINGKQGIRTEWEAIFKIPDFENKSERKGLEVAASRDLAYTTGTYTATLRGEDGAIVQEPGKWVSVWKKQADGSWRIIIDIYNTDIPPPDHK